MNPIELLKDDHRRVLDLFAALSAAPDDAARRGIRDAVLLSLEAHADIEEEIFYPAAKEALGPEGEREVEHGWDEHMEMHPLMEDVRAADVADPSFEGKWEALRETVAHHIRDEEEKMLPRAEDAIPKDRLAVLGDEMHARRAERVDALRKEMGLPRAG